MPKDMQSLENAFVEGNTARDVGFMKRLLDPKTSETELKKLREYLLSGKIDSDPQGMVHLWRCVLLSLYASEEPKLPDNLAALLHCFKKIDTSIQFYGAFLTFVAKEWSFLIEEDRINKFLVLIRGITKNLFVLLNSSKWDEKIIKELYVHIEKCTTNASTSLQFRNHFMNIYLDEFNKVIDELEKVLPTNIDSSTVTLLIQPFDIITNLKDYKNMTFKSRQLIKKIVDRLRSLAVNLSTAKESKPPASPKKVKPSTVTDSEKTKDDQNWEAIESTLDEIFEDQKLERETLNGSSSGAETTQNLTSSTTAVNAGHDEGEAENVVTGSSAKQRMNGIGKLSSSEDIQSKTEDEKPNRSRRRYRRKSRKSWDY